MADNIPSPYQAGQVQGVPRIAIAGHSYASGFGNVDGAEWFGARLCAALGAEEVLYGHTSAVLAWDDSSGFPGGYATAFNAFRPRVYHQITQYANYLPRNASPYLPLAPVTVYYYGFNDLAWLSATVNTSVAWLKMALRAVTCAARAGGIFADTDASVAYGGSGGSHWTANTSVGEFGSPTNHSTTTVNDTVTITVPADFPGGEIDLMTIVSGGGAKWSVTVDGGAARVLDGTGSAFGPSSGRTNLVVQRLTGLAAGAHTIIATVAALDGGATAFFDSWLITAPSLPLVVLCNHPAVPALPYAVGGAPHTPITAADVAALNAAITALAAEFTSVAVADVATAFAAAKGNVVSTSPGSLYNSDNLHPNSSGHALIAATIRAAVTAGLPSGPALFGPMGSFMRQVQANGALPAWPNGGEPAFKANWGLVGNGVMYFTKSRSGFVEIIGAIFRSSAATIGETIFTLPPGYAPEGEKHFFCLSWNSGFTATAAGILSARVTGDVVWYLGDPTTELDLAGTYYPGAPGF